MACRDTNRDRVYLMRTRNFTAIRRRSGGDIRDVDDQRLQVHLKSFRLCNPDIAEDFGGILQLMMQT